MMVLMGDFNAVRFPEERRNSVFNHGIAADFNRFIDDMGLVEYCMRGFKYTFLAGKGKDHKLSKIDRVLVCNDFFNKWPVACLRALPRDFSDHCPLLMTLVDSNFGPKPFRWFNSWLSMVECERVVVNAFEECDFQGNPDEIITAKFRLMRQRLKQWWKETLKKEGEEMSNMKEELEKLEIAMENRELEEEEVWVMEECRKGVGFLNLCHNRDLKQKSRVRWAIDGDENSAFFHWIVSGRKASNSIPGLMVEGEWVSKPALVKKEVFRHFRRHFVDDLKKRPIVKCDNMKRLTRESGES